MCQMCGLFSFLLHLWCACWHACLGDSGFEPWWNQTKDYKIGICCFSTEHAALTYGVRAKTSWLEIRIIMCQSGATCLPIDCCFSDLTK